MSELNTVSLEKELTQGIKNVALILGVELSVGATKPMDFYRALSELIKQFGTTYDIHEEVKNWRPRNVMDEQSVNSHLYAVCYRICDGAEVPKEPVFKSDIVFQLFTMVQALMYIVSAARKDFFMKNNSLIICLDPSVKNQYLYSDRDKLCFIDDENASRIGQRYKFHVLGKKLQ